MIHPAEPMDRFERVRPLGPDAARTGRRVAPVPHQDFSLLQDRKDLSNIQPGPRFPAERQRPPLREARRIVVGLEA